MRGTHRGVNNVGNVKLSAGGLDDGRDHRVMCVANAGEQMVHNLHTPGRGYRLNMTVFFTYKDSFAVQGAYFYHVAALAL
jgi:hypothetical protein